LVIATLVGRFAAGWYFLYPLPYRSGGAWPNWATDVYLIALTILGVAWTLWAVDLLRAIAQRYSLAQALCWHYLAGATQPEVPPLVLITTVCTVASLTGFIAAVILLAFFAADRLAGVPADPLLMKNLVFYFGHVLVNITMYLGVAMLYDVLPQYVGHPWKTTATTAFAWNAVLVLVLFAYFHHLYMDFAQPKAVQILGQLASYMISLPAAVVSILGALAMVYRAKVRWTLASALLFVGTMGWAIGGVAAVIDSTIATNFRFHNTLWVPAHFHTYFLMGVVLMIMGFLAHFTAQLSGKEETPVMRRAILTLLLVGGYGFLLMFYLAGAHHVPRRYAIYPEELAQGILYARLSLPFVTLLSLGVLLYLVEVGKRWRLAFAAAKAPSS
jgi:cytochrome c oxidase subunit 1